MTPRGRVGLSDFTEFTPFWDALYTANADVVLNGHDHNYQRYQPMNPSGAADSARGIRQFAVGSGGRSHVSAGRGGHVHRFGLWQLPLSGKWRCELA